MVNPDWFMTLEWLLLRRRRTTAWHGLIQKELQNLTLPWAPSQSLAIMTRRTEDRGWVHFSKDEIYNNLGMEWIEHNATARPPCFSSGWWDVHARVTEIRSLGHSRPFFPLFSLSLLCKWEVWSSSSHPRQAPQPGEGRLKSWIEPPAGGTCNHHARSQLPTSKLLFTWQAKPPLGAGEGLWYL